MKKLKHIIWDWNGTLLDDLDVSIEALNTVLVKEGLPQVYDKEKYKMIFQFPVIEYYRKAGFDFEKTPFSVLANYYMEYYRPHSFACHLHKGSEQVLSFLQKQGIRQHLLSATKLSFLHKQVAHYDLYPYFENICGLDNSQAHSKKELAKQFVKEHQLEVDKTVFIGDSVHDYEVASAAGCNCILIANGHEHKLKLLKTNALVLDSLDDFYNLYIKDFA